jgi:hypothetical protein
MNFVPLLLVHLCIRLPTLAMFMNASSGVQCKRYQADWSVILLQHQSLPASSGVPHEFCTLLLVHLCNTLLLAMLMIARCGVTAETAC